MVQRRVYTRNERQPQKFVPRRDLFPDAVLQPSKIIKPKSQALPMWQTPLLEKTDKSNNKNPQAIKLDPGVLILLLLGWLFIWPRIRKNHGDVLISLQSKIKDVASSPQTLQMLQDITPYLDGKEQETAYTVLGVLEVINSIKEILNHTYHSKHQNKILQVPLNPNDRNVEMLRVIKPYIPDEGRHTLDSVIKTYDAINKLNKNIEIYRNNRTLSGQARVSTLESIYDIIKVAKPIIPSKYQDRADKTMQVLKMLEAIELSDKINKDIKKSKAAVKDKESSEIEETEEVQNKLTSGNTNQAEQMIDSLKSMLNDEQKESVDIIMKMAQLLAQPSQDDE